MKRYVLTLLVTLLVGLFVAGISTPASAGTALHRLSAEFQWAPTLGAPEILTTLPPAPAGAGGKIVYSKTLWVPNSFRTLYVTFWGTGDTHQNEHGAGAALLMTCLIDGVPCQPGTGLITAGPSAWITLQKMPQPVSITNCSDGGGGSADCHDNNLTHTWCIPLERRRRHHGSVHTVDLKLASSNGGIVFYERSHIYIDATKKSKAKCNPAEEVDGATSLP